MSDDRRLLVVHEAEDASPAATFASRLENALPAWTVETFAPSAAFERTGSSLIREARARVQSADAVLCILGTSSASSQWLAWALQVAKDMEKRSVGVRLHDNAIRDAAPQTSVGRDLPVLNADLVAVVAFLERGTLPDVPSDSPLLARFARRR